MKYAEKNKQTIFEGYYYPLPQVIGGLRLGEVYFTPNISLKGVIKSNIEYGYSHTTYHSFIYNLGFQVKKLDWNSDF